MNLLQRSRQFFTALALVMVLFITTACGSATQAKTSSPNALNPSINYAQLQRGNTNAGQEFGDWVVQTAKGLVSDAYVRDNDKLGVVITPQVRPQEVQNLVKSLTQGFHHNFPNRNLSVLVYAPDKKLIMTAKYDNQTNQINYQAS